MARTPKYLKPRPAWQKKAMVTYAKSMRPGSSSIGRGISIGKSIDTFSTVRTTTLSRVTASNLVETDVAYAFTLNDVPNSTDFTNLYDEYRIDKVQITWYPDTQQTLTTAGQGNTTCLTVLDYDDATAANLLALEQYESCQSHSSIRPFSRTVIPRFAKAVYAGAFTSFSSGTGWVDTASSAVQHYGIKIAIPIQVGTANSYTPIAKYWMSFRRTR